MEIKVVHHEYKDGEFKTKELKGEELEKWIKENITHDPAENED